MLGERVCFEAKSLGERVSVATKVSELLRGVPWGKTVWVLLARAEAKIEPAANIKRGGQAFNSWFFGRKGWARGGGCGRREGRGSVWA